MYSFPTEPSKSKPPMVNEDYKSRDWLSGIRPADMASISLSVVEDSRSDSDSWCKLVLALPFPLFVRACVRAFIHSCMQQESRIKNGPVLLPQPLHSESPEPINSHAPSKRRAPARTSTPSALSSKRSVHPVIQSRCTHSETTCRLFVDLEAVR